MRLRGAEYVRKNASARLKERLKQATLAGQVVDLRSEDPSANDPAQGGQWDEERTVPATVLAELLTEVDRPRHRALHLVGARITGTLDLETAELASPVLMEGCYFDQQLSLANVIVPVLRLAQCHLPSLMADHLTTQGNFDFRNGITSGGEVRLLGAHIGGNLLFGGAALSNPGRVALGADGLRVDHSMFCRAGFTALGEVRLAGVSVGGVLDLDGATLINPDGVALEAHELTVSQAAYFRGLTAQGQVQLIGAQIGGQLNFDEASIDNGDRLTLDLQDVRAPTLFLRRLEPPPSWVDFTHGRVGTLSDDPSSWPGKAELRGFEYDALYEKSPVSAHQRLELLSRDTAGYSPQPYEQLAAVYRRAGRDQDVRTVAIAKERARRKTLTLPGKLWSLLLDVLVGYGYRTWKAGLAVLGLLVLGAGIFAAAHPQKMALAKKAGDPLPAFQPWAYSLDVLLPVVNLHQEEFWIPRGAARWWAWFSILAGWLLTSIVLAALTGLLKRD
jgi:hypothetical protein